MRLECLTQQSTLASGSPVLPGCLLSGPKTPPQAVLSQGAQPYMLQSVPSNLPSMETPPPSPLVMLPALGVLDHSLSLSLGDWGGTGQGDNGEVGSRYIKKEASDLPALQYWIMRGERNIFITCISHFSIFFISEYNNTYTTSGTETTL